MNLLVLISTLLTAAITLVNCKSNRVQPNTRSECTRLLESVIYKPENCAFKYMNTLGLNFRSGAQIIFLDDTQKDSYIFNFASEYHVNVTLINPFGPGTNYHFDGSKTVAPPPLYTNTAQAFLNFPGFIRQVSDERFYYTIQIFSPEAEYYGVTIWMPLARDPIVC